MRNWGTLEDMMLHYMKGVAKVEEESRVLFCKTIDKSYGTCSLEELKEMQKIYGTDMCRTVAGMTAEEMFVLLTVRYSDIIDEVANVLKAEDLQTGEQPSSEPAALDAAGDRAEEGGRGKDNGGRAEKDNSGTVH